MISYEAYKVIHLLAVIMVFIVLGAAAVTAWNGGTRDTDASRRAVSLLHGTGLLVALLSGFGLVSRLDLMEGGMPLWVWGKLIIWLLVGLALVVPRRNPALARPMLLFGLPFLAAAAAWLAVYKPGN